MHYIYEAINNKKREKERENIQNKKKSTFRKHLYQNLVQKENRITAEAHTTPPLPRGHVVVVSFDANHLVRY
jgi:hypothetical protein